MNCKNCDHIVKENYCEICGQNAKVKRINVSNFLHDLSESVFQINRGFFFTIKELFMRPRASLTGYLEGKRQNIVKPITHAFALSTIFFLLSQLTDGVTFLDDFIVGWENGELSKTTSAEIHARQLAIFDWFARHYSYTILLMLPLYSLTSFLSFRKCGYNYLEHVVINAYLIGQQAIFYSIFSLVGGLINSPDFVINLSLVTSLVYAFYVYSQLFAKHTGKWFTLRYLCLYFLSITIQMVMVGLVVFWTYV